MQKVSALFWNASVEEIKKGYIYDFPSETYTCLICGEVFEKGRIYGSDGLLFEAEKAAANHVSQKHFSVFSFLLGLDKKYTGLTEHQKKLLELFYQGYDDKEIAAALGGSLSTVRNHRFNFREKEKEAKITLAILQLLNERLAEGRGKAAKLVDDRYAISEEESAKVMKLYFKEGPDGPLSHFPAKEKRKIIVLRHLLKRFEAGKTYSEQEVNKLIKEVYADYVTVRRCFIEYGFMERTPDGSSYWVKG